MNARRLIFLRRLLALGLLTIGWGCVSSEKFTYLQKKEGGPPAFGSAETYQLPTYEYKIRPGDLLAIQIISAQPSKFATEKVLPPAEKYVVSDSGTIALPAVGVIQLAGLSPRQASAQVQRRVNEVFDEVFVQVRSLGFTITVFGEVKQPGTLVAEREQVTLFEALAQSGDLTDLADRAAVRLIRKQGNQANSVQLDLTNDKLLDSPYFYLEPGDVVYVPPMAKAKKRALARQDAVFYLSLVNVLVALGNVFIFARATR
ncbi:MAG: polysaccharide biosynthesis/export family protein [Bernardetiaceae bacterium]|jgi:polysaccharide export outer membrane protein|nr:polysaccharide biosynthesis/export family protein [Bernardetiaceae bacterium]